MPGYCCSVENILFWFFRFDRDCDSSFIILIVTLLPPRLAGAGALAGAMEPANFGEAGTKF